MVFLFLVYSNVVNELKEFQDGITSAKYNLELALEVKVAEQTKTTEATNKIAELTAQVQQMKIQQEGHVFSINSVVVDQGDELHK